MPHVTVNNRRMTNVQLGGGEVIQGIRRNKVTLHVVFDLDYVPCSLYMITVLQYRILYMITVLQYRILYRITVYCSTGSCT